MLYVFSDRTSCYGNSMNCCEALLEATKVITRCQCKSPGFCPVIKCTLNAHGHALCKGIPGYYELWTTNGGAPCTGIGELHPLVFGLGDIVAWIIRKLTFNRIKPCTGCKSRMAYLNRFQIWPIPWSKSECIQIAIVCVNLLQKAWRFIRPDHSE